MEKAEKAEKADKVVAVALAVAEVEAVVVALAVVMEIEETFKVDVSVNNLKIDHPQPLSGKSHMCRFSKK